MEALSTRQNLLVLCPYPRRILVIRTVSKWTLFQCPLTAFVIITRSFLVKLSQYHSHYDIHRLIITKVPYIPLPRSIINHSTNLKTFLWSDQLECSPNFTHSLCSNEIFCSNEPALIDRILWLTFSLVTDISPMPGTNCLGLWFQLQLLIMVSLCF